MTDDEFGAVGMIDNSDFGTTCIDCGEPIDDERPYVPDAEGELIHVGCGDPPAEVSA